MRSVLRNIRQMSQVTSTNPSHARIGIVGAGVGGLSLACRLSAKNIPFTLYEARDADSIGHGYGITLHENECKVLLEGAMMNTSFSQLRARVAVDHLAGGTGRVSKDSKPDSNTFQATDRDFRLWLLERLKEKGIDVKWNHKLTKIAPTRNGEGVGLEFEHGGSESIDLLVDTGGLRSPAFDANISQPPTPNLLPYATYYGTRRIPSSVFSKEFASYFGDGNTLTFAPSNASVPYISFQKIHHRSKEPTSTQSPHIPNHTVEIRWVYSRPPKSDNDPLFRPNRAPNEAKDIPEPFYEEVLAALRASYRSDSDRDLLTHLITPQTLRSDRILNWHLRLRLPSPSYFEEHALNKSAKYQISALGDAAHGLPIVQSRGACVALRDSQAWADWYVEHSEELVKDATTSSFYDSQKRFEDWYQEAVESVQNLRNIHGQSVLSKSELQEIIGFAGPTTIQEDFGASSNSKPDKEKL